MSKYDPDEMAARGRIGGLTTQARHGMAATAPATRGFLNKFLREVDPDGVLPKKSATTARSTRCRLTWRGWPT